MAIFNDKYKPFLMTSESNRPNGEVGLGVFVPPERFHEGGVLGVLLACREAITDEVVRCQRQAEACNPNPPLAKLKPS